MNSGVMLLEVLIAAFISLLLISVLTRFYFIIQKNEIWRQQLEVQQDTAQKVISILRNDIFRAGYIGCGKLSNEFTVTPYQQYSLTIDNFLQVEENKLTLRYQFFPGAVMMNNMSGKSKIISNKSQYFHAGQLAIISDCQHAEIFRVSNVWVYGDAQIIIPELPLRHHYQQFAEIGAFVIRQYYLAPAKHQPNSVSLIRALFRADIKSRYQMVEGVDGLIFSNLQSNVYFQFKTISINGEKTWYGIASNRCCNHT